MNNFIYYNPVKLIFGKDEVMRLETEISQDKKVLMIYGGGSIKKNGIYDQVKKALNSHNLVEFGGVEPNPKYETLMKAVNIARKEQVDILLAVGGGSVIDGTKFIAAAALYEGNDPWDMLAKGEKVKKALPLGTVLTLPATGSEMNSTSVVSRESTREKLPFAHPGLFPKFSILDPRVVYSLPEKQIRNGIVDAYVHVLEQYLTTDLNTEVQDRWAEGILNALKATAPKVMANKSDYDNAANLMLEASMALNGILRIGIDEDWSTHLIGHEITALHGIDHAETLSIVLPGVMNEMRYEKSGKLKQYAERVWGICDDEAEDAIIDNVIDQTEVFFRETGMNTRLSEHNIPVDTIREIEKRFKNRPGFDELSETGGLTPDRVVKVLESRM